MGRRNANSKWRNTDGLLRREVTQGLTPMRLLPFTIPNSHGVSWGGVPPFKSTPWESSRPGVGRGLNHYFGCQIRNQRGRFTPGGFLLEEFFENFVFFFSNFLKFWHHCWFKIWSKPCLNLSKHCQNIAQTLSKHV